MAISENCQNYIISFCLILCGTYSSINSKFIYQTKFHGLPDKDGNTLRMFEFPLFNLLLMFVGEFYCLIIHLISQMCRSKSKSAPVKQLSDDDQSFFVKYVRYLLVIPAACDMIGSGCSFIGLLSLESSVSGMLNGSMTIFVGLLNWVILRRKLNKKKWCSIGLSMAGILCISLEVLLNSKMSTKASAAPKVPLIKALTGVVLILFGNFVSAFQSIFDEKVMKGSSNISAVENVGLQGLYGSIMTIIILFICYFIPGSAPPNNCMENALDAFTMLSNSPMLILNSFCYTVVIMALNILGMQLTSNTSALQKTFNSSLRNVMVWTVEVFMFYVVHSEIYGKVLNVNSIAKVTGLGLLISAAVVSNSGKK